ncbi:MAG TPA: S24/S26 family peptidase [Terriglobales bacterium]|nr:S24/S26 family peptidase [Terriglobales bacterium]
MPKELLHSAGFGEFASQLVERGCGFRFQARGRSMFPTINDGDILQVCPLGKRKLRVGDIVLVRADQEFKAHRIIQKRGELLVLRGDAGRDADGTFRQDQLIGLVFAKERSDAVHMVRLSGFGPRLNFRLRELWRRVHLALH